MKSKKTTQPRPNIFILILAAFVIISAITVILSYQNRIKPASASLKVYRISDINGSVAVLEKFMFDARKEFLAKYNLTEDTRGYLGPKMGEAYLLTSTSIKTGSKFEFEDGSFTVLAADDAKLPYIQDSKYCLADSDCGNFSSFCSLSISNGYSPMATYGCVTESDSTLTSEEKGKCPKTPLPGGDYQSTATVKYTKITCDNHVCTGHGRQVYCAK